MKKRPEIHSPSASAALRIGEADHEILAAVNRLQYMTAAQIGRLLYPDARDENRYVQRRLRKLAEAGYLLRLRELPSPRVGSAPHVFTLADKGRQYLSGQGVQLLTTYYRPSEERRKAQDNPFMEHTLAAVDVLVAAERLCQDFLVSMPRLLTERQLKRRPVRVQPPAGRPGAPPMAVIPDAWFELTTTDDPVAIALELDRSTEHQKHWRRKVACLTAWALGPYREAFQADNLTVAVAVPAAARRAQLSTWTKQELDAIGQPGMADIFLFSEASPVTTDPVAFFFSPLWYPAGQQHPVSLLDPPESAEEEVSTSVPDPFSYRIGPTLPLEREVE
ncbi:replication-relaxation family protein [Streptomyces graminilatus]|uniref:replication-relaxation family protein n=1 Tax=Streptomyces graminilatus TaxID=1464070 RepID=UPI00099F1234|nr:replication-relaxation family protein [Streptomyces graminilatus]